MKKIFIYSVDNNKGGIENYTLNLIKSVLSQTGSYRFHILTQFNDFAFKEIFVNQLGCEFTVLPNEKKHPLMFYKMLFNLLRTNSKEIFQINAMSYCNSFVFKAAKYAKIRTIIVGHASGTQNLLKKILHEINWTRFGKFGEKIAVSDMANQYMFHGKGEVIQNGINKSKYIFNKSARNKLRTKFFIKESDMIVGQFGRISPLKNQIFTAKIFQHFPNNYHLFFVGKCQNKNMVRKILKYKNQNIHFIDENNEINRYYSMIDIFLFPSKSEGAGLALYEALTSGCVCFASNHVPKVQDNDCHYLKLNKKKWIKEILNATLNNLRTDKLSKNILSIEEQGFNYINFYNKGKN